MVPGGDELPALGFLELKSIARGLFLTDVLVKKAPIKILASKPVSSGKHVILYFGDVASVEESHQAALDLEDGELIREVLIPGVHRDLAPFLDSIWMGEGKFSAVEIDDAVGIVESKSLAAAIMSADKTLKAAEVRLARFRLGQGIGGKAYFLITGRQEEVEAGLEAAEASLKEHDGMERIDFIARPLEDALAHF